MRRIAILVPSLSPAGPVKGAIALANALSVKRDVILVPVKPGPGADAPIDPAVQLLPLFEAGGWRARVRRLTEELRRCGRSGRQGAAMISYCLSADAMAFAARHHARWISSVRGNLPRNYRFDFGPIGPLIATGHLVTLRAADRVVAMTPPMAAQVARYIGRRPEVIGNFVDEAPLEPFRRPPDPTGAFRFAFLASLGARKQPLLLVEALQRLAAAGHAVHLDIVGEGPLRGELETAARAGGLDGRVTLHGYLARPFDLLARADALVLPSLSEGISRAVLEALHLGVPVVLRDVDGNRHVVTGGRNGALFTRDANLPDAMLAAARLRRSQPSRESLLPTSLRQTPCAQAFLDLAESD